MAAPVIVALDRQRAFAEPEPCRLKMIIAVMGREVSRGISWMKRLRTTASSGVDWIAANGT